MGDPSSGRLIAGRYRLSATLGRGGMGIVWRGRDELLGRPVAVKEVLLPPGLSDEEQRVAHRRTLREARVAARLGHPNVVLVYDVVEEGGRPWIVMELVSGRSLEDTVRADGPLPPARAAGVGQSVLAALRVAHAAGILHRDVKPSNVLLAEDGRVVLTDFGIATVQGEGTLTDTGTLLGSPAYMAPERVTGGRASRESDLWSLGAMLYTAVEGRPPHDRGAALPTLHAVVNEELDPPRRAGPLRPVIEGLLVKDPASRLAAERARRLLDRVAHPPPQVPAAAHAEKGEQHGSDDLDSAVSPEDPGSADGRRGPIPVAPERQSWKGARRRALLAGAGAAILAIGAASWVVLHDPQQRPDHVASGPERGSPDRAAGESPPPRGTGERKGKPPANFHRYRDPTGFSVAVPDGWSVSREGQAVRFEQPAGERFLIVDQTTDPQPDPVADWKRQEEARRGNYADYRRVRIAAVKYHQKAADWEFTYAGDSGRIHVLNRGFVTGPNRAYAIYWSTPADKWKESLHYLKTFTNTFRPAS